MTEIPGLKPLYLDSSKLSGLSGGGVLMLVADKRWRHAQKVKHLLMVHLLTGNKRILLWAGPLQGSAAGLSPVTIPLAAAPDPGSKLQIAVADPSNAATPPTVATFAIPLPSSSDGASHNTGSTASGASSDDWNSDPGEQTDNANHLNKIVEISATELGVYSRELEGSNSVAFAPDSPVIARLMLEYSNKEGLSTVRRVCRNNLSSDKGYELVVGCHSGEDFGSDVNSSDHPVFGEHRVRFIDINAKLPENSDNSRELYKSIRCFKHKKQDDPNAEGRNALFNFAPQLELAPDVQEISPIESDNCVTFEFSMESPSPHSSRRGATVFNGLNTTDTFCIVAPAWCRMKFAGKLVEGDDSIAASWITEFHSRLSNVAGFQKPVQMLWFTYDGQRFFGQDSYGIFSEGLQAGNGDNPERISQERHFALTSIGEYLASHCREIDQYLPWPAGETPEGKNGEISPNLLQLGTFGEMDEESAWQKLEPLLQLARYHQLAEVCKCGVTEAFENPATRLSADLTGLFSARMNRRFVWRPLSSIEANTQSASGGDIIADLILDACQNYREMSAPVFEMVKKPKLRKVLENLLWHALYNDLADLGFLLSAIIKRDLVVSDDDRFQPEFATTAYKLTRAEFQPAPLLEDARGIWFSELGASGDEPGTEASDPSWALEEFNGKSLGEVRKNIETLGVIRRQAHEELSRLRSTIDGNPVFWGLALSMGKMPDRNQRQPSVVSLAHRYMSPLAQQFINTTFVEAAIPLDQFSIGVASHLLEKIDGPSQKFSKEFIDIFGGLHQSVSEHLDINIAEITTQFALGPGLIRSEFRDYHDFVMNEINVSSDLNQRYSSKLQKAGKPLIEDLAALCLPRRRERFDRWFETQPNRSPLQQFCDAVSLQLLVRHMRGILSETLEKYPQEIPGNGDRKQIAYALRQLLNFPGKTNWQFHEFLNLVTKLQNLTNSESELIT